MKAHPILLTIAAITALVAAFKWLDNTFTITLDAQRKKTQKLTDEYNTLAQEVQSLEGELTTIKQRIEEINALDDPTFTDDQELKRLEKQVALLERERDLKKEAAQEKANETNESVQSEYDRQYKTVGELTGANTYHSIYDFVDYDARGQKVKVGKAISGEQYYEELIRKVKELNDLRDNTNAEDWVGSADERALADYTAKLQNMSTEFGTLATKVTITDDASIVLYNSLADMADMGEAVANGDYWSFLLNKAGKDNIQEKSNKLKGLSDSLAVADTTEKTAQAAQKLQSIISQDTGLSNMISQAEGLGYAAEGSLSALTAWDGTIEGMTPKVAEAANSIGQLIAWLFEVSKASNDGAAPAVNSLKTALAGLSDETTVLRDAMAKLGEGSAVFDTWVKADDNLKSLLDKFPNLRDELEAYASVVASGEDSQKAFITLQRAMNAALQDFNTDEVSDGVSNVVDAVEKYGASSNRVLQEVQNLDQYIPGLVNSLYDESGALDTSKVAALQSADALFDYCAQVIQAENTSKKTDLDNLVSELSKVASMSYVADKALENFNKTGSLPRIDAIENHKDNIGSYVAGQKVALDMEYKKQMEFLNAARDNYHRSQSSKNSKDVYLPDVDPLYQYLQTVEDINDELDRLDIDEKLLDEDDFEGKNKLIEARIKKLEELKTALHVLNDARDVEISTAVDKLNGYGDFQATYDAESGQALINNMDALNGLTGDTAKAVEELISAIENGSKSALSTSNEYMEALVEQNNLLKEQKELREEEAENQADDALERIKNRISRLQNRQDTFATNIDHQNVMHDLGAEKQAYQDMIDLAVRRGKELRAAGATDDYPELAKWSQAYFEGVKGMRDTNRKMVDEILKPYDEFISNADTYSWWDNLDDTKADVLGEKLAKIHDMYKTGLIPDAEMYKELVNETAEALYKEQLDAIDKTIEYTEELIKKEHELREEELEEQKSDYKAIVEAKKESLRTSKEEADYQKSVAEKTKAIAKLQQQINTLSLSDDRRDIAERKKLEEELAQLQGELSDTQADHSLSAQEDALDKSYEAFEKEKDDEIKVVKAEVDTVGKVYALAIDRINSGWDNLYKDLAEWNRNYADGIKGEDGLEGAWKTAKSAASEYFDVLDARQGLEKKYVSASGGNIAVGDTDVYKDKYGLDWDTHKTVQEKANQMRSNSNAWHAANSAGNTYLAGTYVSKNEELVKEIESLIGKKLYRDGDGVWHINDGQGTQLYKVYHRGGIVGSNEEFAKVEKGELVVPKEHVQPTMKMLEWGNSLASKMRGLFSGGGLVSSSMGDAIKGAPLSPAAGAIVNNNAPNFAPNINVEVKYDGSSSPADAKRFGENITAGIVEAFRRKGIGVGTTPLLTGI